MKKIRNLAVLLILVILLVSLLGLAVGKYKTTVSAGGGSVEFTASLAEDLVLREHEALRQADGQYNLSAAITTNGNTYHLIPGVDIPKDPHVIVKGKTKIPAYLFIEIEGSLDPAVVYNVDTSIWTYLKTEGNKSVYYYKDVLQEGFSSNEIYILTSFASDGKTCNVEVRQNLLQVDTATDVLKIKALLIEKLGNDDAAATYAKR